MAYGVEYKKEEWQSAPVYKIGGSANSKIAQWIIKNSRCFIKNERQANFVLIIFFVLMTIFSLVIISSGSKSGGKENPVVPAEAVTR